MEGMQLFSLALKSDGSIVGWGDNDYGQASPPAGNDYTAITAGNLHTIALKSDGSIVGWGYNYDGQATPPEGNNYTAVAAGGMHSLALKSDGSIVAWGNNYYGSPPVGNNYIAIAAGELHSLALKSDGSIVGWGDNHYGQTNPPAGNNFIAISAGAAHGLALKSDGSIVGWGFNRSGQANPPQGNDYVAIAAGYSHSLALKSDGSIVGWGNNWYGQTNSPAGNNYLAVAAGYSYSLALQNTPPVTNAGPDQTIEAQAPWGAKVTLNGSNSTDADSTPGTNDDIVSFDWYEQIDPCDSNSNVLLGTGQTIDCNLPLGTHTIILEVTDNAGESDTDVVIITVQDTTPPQFTLSVTPTILWPISKRMIKITPTWTVTDLCDPNPIVSLLNIKTSEPADGDIQTDPDGSIYLRAWRSGTGAGRVYTITFQAVDDSGNSAQSSATVTVPHDQRSSK